MIVLSLKNMWIKSIMVILSYIKQPTKVYYQFEGIPSQEVLDKLYEYSERYGVEVIIDGIIISKMEIM